MFKKNHIIFHIFNWTGLTWHRTACFGLSEMKITNLKWTVAFIGWQYTNSDLKLKKTSYVIHI